MKNIFLIATLFPSLALASFTDVPTGHDYVTAIEYLQEQNIVGGYGDGSFKPQTSINRAEFTKIIVEANYSKNQIANCKTNGGFSDIEYSAWYRPYICMAQQEALVSGYPNGTFGPGNDIVLSEAGKIVSKAFDLTVDQSLTPWYAPYLDRLGDLEAIPPTLQDPGQALNRGEMAELIYRLMTDTKNQPASQIIFKPGDEEFSQENFNDDQKHELLVLVNEARAHEGLPPLTRDKVLDQVAQGYAQQMDDEGFFSHEDPNGINAGQRLTAAGYSWQYVGENIAKGQVTADYVFETWRESPGHWANILSADYQEIGLGQYKVTDDNFYKGYFWVQVFGTKK